MVQLNGCFTMTAITAWRLLNICPARASWSSCGLHDVPLAFPLVERRGYGRKGTGEHLFKVREQVPRPRISSATRMAIPVIFIPKKTKKN